MKAICFNLLAWVMLPIMDGFAKYLSTDLPILQITWARYFFTVVIRPGFEEVNFASFSALGTGIMYGFYLIITRKLSTSDNPLLTLLLTGLVGAVIISFAMPFVWIQPSINQWTMMAAIGIFASIGHFFLILSLKYADASKLAPFSYFEIITNIMIGYYFFNDFPDSWTFFGLLIIVMSGVYIYKREQIVSKSI